MIITCYTYTAMLKCHMRFNASFHSMIHDATSSSLLLQPLELHNLSDNLDGTASLEDDSGGQAGDLVVVLGVDIGEDSVLALKQRSAHVFHYTQKCSLPEEFPWEDRRPWSTPWDPSSEDTRDRRSSGCRTSRPPG